MKNNAKTSTAHSRMTKLFSNRWVVKILIILAAFFMSAGMLSRFIKNWDTVIGVSFGIAGVTTYILTERTLSQTSKDLAKIKELSDSIADSSRKPLNGIVEILHECDKLLEASEKPGGNIWFVGLTLGIGPAHAIKANIDEWQSKYPTEKTFRAMIDNIHGNLGATLGGARSRCIVILSETLVESKFITPLYGDANPNAAYRNHCEMNPDHLHRMKQWLNQLATETKQTLGGYRPIEISNIPLQLIVVDVKKDGILKRACVVFHVGTENIGYGAVQGIYSELPNLCEIFQNFCESLAATKQ